MNVLRKNKWLRGVAWTVLAVLVLWLLSWLLVPPVLKSQLQKIGTEQLGRAVTVGSVDFKPWSLELTLNDIAVAGAATGAAPLLHVGKAYVNAEFQSVFRLAPVIDAVTVDGVQVEVSHLGDGKYDFDDIIDKLAKNAAPADPAKGPARFALYNLSLGNASVNYNDLPMKRKHELRDLALTVPFISSFDGQRDVNVEPRLAFVLNGSRFDSAAVSTPFAQTRKTDATLRFSGFDLQPYLQYIPASVPVKVQGAVLDAELKLGFEQTPRTAVTLSGTLRASKVKVADAQSRDLFSMDELKVALLDVRPLEKVARLGAIELSSPSLAVRRDAAGQINLLMAPGTRAEDGVVAATATAAAAAASSAGAAPHAASAASGAASGVAVAVAPAAWNVSVASVALKNGKVGWEDAAAGPQPAVLALTDLAVDASDIVVPFDKPLKFKITAALSGESGSGASSRPSSSSPGQPAGPGRITAEGTATDKVAQVKAGISEVSLGLVKAYLAPWLEPELAGQLAADVDIAWRATGPLEISAPLLVLDQLTLVSTLPEDQRVRRSGGSGRAAQASGSGPGRSTAPGQRTSATRSQAPTPQRTAPVRNATSASAAALARAAEPTTGPVAKAAAEASPAQASDTAGQTTVARIRQLKIVDAAVDLASRTASIGSVTISDPRANVTRSQDKRWMFERWMKVPAGSTANAASASTSEGPAPAVRPAGQPTRAAQRSDSDASRPSSSPKPTWAVTVAELALDGGSVVFSDNAGYKPVNVVTTDLKVRMSKIAQGAAPASPSPLSVSAKVGSGRTEFGSLDFQGTLGLQPLAAQGQLNVVRFPVHAMQPYFGDVLNVELVRADTSFKGSLKYAAGPSTAPGPTAASGASGASARIIGDAQIENFRANSNPQSATASASTGTPAAGAKANASDLAAEARSSGSIESALTTPGQGGDGEELLSWKSLGLRGIDVSMAPAGAITVDVKQTALTDVYARLILKENARLNLQDLVKSPTDVATASAPSTATAQPASATPAAPAASRPASTKSAKASSSTPVIRFGPVNLVNAKVLFSDHFVQPNYSANLTELSGSLSAFTSVVAPGGEPQLADLELRGKAENTASLDITGKLNPLANPLALDIRAKVRDLELPPLTPYSVKYSGYGIQRGKMSIDVHYQVQPDGQLTAENKVVLNQLSFGDKVAGSTASLPVKLAVALLADRNGVIDLDIPLSGSLNDPQFSLGAVIGKAVVNLVLKAITAPFTLIANAFRGSGGADQSSAVEFKPGSVALSSQAKASLDQVAAALVERPALKMSVVGTASIDAEREPYRRERLNQLLQAEKRKAAGAAPNVAQAAQGARPGASSASAPAAATVAPVDITPAEYPALIKAVYDSADIAKPRNVVGIARALDTSQMEALLLQNVSVSDESIRELAVERGVAVRDYLASRNLPLDRLFLGSAKAERGIPAPTPQAVDPEVSASAAAAGAASAVSSASSAPPPTRVWVPSAELTLSPR